MCDLEKELVIYFFNVIMETNFIGQYQIPVEEPICVEKFVSPLIDNLNENSEQQPESKVSFIDTTMFQQRPLKDSSSESLLMTFVYQKEKLRSIARRKSDTNGSTGRKTSGGNGKSARKESTLGKRKSNQTDASRKDLVAHERRRSQGNPLQPITEDNLVDSAIEKVISTNNLEYDWLIKCDEKYSRITFKNGNVYEGDVAEKIPHGKGTFWWADGTVYEGEFEDGSPTGRGKMQLPDLTEYTGTFYKGYFHGNGVYNIRTTSMMYSGGWKYGKKHGEGWLLYQPNIWYEGEFEDDLRHGRGFFQFDHTSCYEGAYFRNKRQGHGAMRWPNNDIYIGEWSNGIINGSGEYSWKTVFNNTFAFPVQHYYKGSWVNGKRTGTGVMFFGTENGAKMAGIFQDNFKHGAAVVVCGNGRSIEKNPLFFNDKPIHIFVSMEDIPKESSSAIFNTQMYQNVVKTGFTDKQWPTKIHPSSITSQLLQHAKQEKGALCNPIEIQIHASPEDIDLTFYIEKALGMYVNAFDTIQFDLESNESCCSSNASRIQLSKWNLMTMNNNSIPPSKVIKSIAQDNPIVFGRCSVNQPTNPLNKSDSKFQSTLRSEEKYLRNVITRHLPKLMDIYYHYATITFPKKVYFKHYMIRMFLWQMYLDVEITNLGISLVEIDKLLDENPASYVESCHHPFEHIYFFQFIQSLMGTALLVHYKSREEVHSSEGLTSYIFQKFLLERLFVKAGCHRGRCLFEFKDVLPIKNVYALYLRLGEPHTARQFLNVACTKKGEEPPCYRAWSGNKESLIANFLGNNVNAVGHNFLYIPEKEVVGEQPEEYLNEIEEIDPYFQDLSTLRILGPKIIVQCLYTVCPAIIQNNLICTMDYSMTFLEFYEVLICCALSVLAKIRKKKIFIKKLFTEEPKAEDIADLDTSSRKGSAKLKRKK